MLHRYLIAIARPGAAPDRLECLARRIDPAMAGPLIWSNTSCRVYAAGADWLAAPASGPVIIGPLYDADHRRVRRIGSEERGGPGAQLDRLLRNGWGAYVAVAADPDGVSILRDPSGGLSCYRVETDDLVLAGPDVALLLALAERSAAIDWDFIRHHLRFRHVRPARTALAGVTELLPGERLDVTGDGAMAHQAWSPWEFTARERQIADSAEAAERLRVMVSACIAARGRDFSHVLLGLSGGLDSSIVAAALQAGGVRVTALNLATRQRSGDEAHFAEAVARHLAIPLHVVRENADDVDLRASASAALPRPIARAFAQSGDAAYLRLGEEIGADGFFGGGGGDNVFCYLPSARPLADRMRVEGPFSNWWPTARDLGRMMGVAVWPVVRRAIETASRSDPRYRFPAENDWLSSDGETWGGLDHPWLEPPHGTLPGKAAHVAWILGIQNHIEGYRRERVRPKISPLMSQPIVELCLRIPSWHWCADGRNRAVARVAFRDMLPAAIIDRRTKASPGAFLADLYQSRRAQIAEILLDGQLARSGLLDRARLERELAADGPVRDYAYSRILGLVDVESWLRAWTRIGESAPLRSP